jgi:hypothetical protein
VTSAAVDTKMTASEISEHCSCGARFTARGEAALRLHRAWVKRHICPDQPPEIQRDFESTSTIGFAPDFIGTGMDIPARTSDPFDDE